ncbi:MAG: DUF167 domain-containing protein [Candidatus Nanoarchaeia archaeon]
MESKKVIQVHVKPNSKESSIVFDEEKQVYVARVKAAPEDGKANAEVLKLVKKMTGKEARIISGATSKKKLVRIG